VALFEEEAGNLVGKSRDAIERDTNQPSHSWPLLFKNHNIESFGAVIGLFHPLQICSDFTDNPLRVCDVDEEPGKLECLHVPRKVAKT
jgi:hypothetical protein